jgi:hypothetical protein
LCAAFVCDLSGRLGRCRAQLMEEGCSDNGTGIAAEVEAAYNFIAGHYEANDFTFENLGAWLRENVAPATV